MDLSSVSIKDEYRSLEDDIVQDFLVPALKEAKIYKRAVGFFSSTSLLEISIGISGLKKNGGVIKLIASPNLSPEDIGAIQAGYKTREQVVEDSVMREVSFLGSSSDAKRLNMLANLIADGTLDIKIVMTEHAEHIGMYHEKMAIISDGDSKIAFSGSPNESLTAFKYNYETIDVYWSWNSEQDVNKIRRKEEAFDRIWAGIDPNLKSIDTSKLKSEIVDKFKTESIDWKNHIEDIPVEFIVVEEETKYQVKLPFPKVPIGFNFHHYQEEAINNWLENNGRGIFDMATGTGKTFTGLGALSKLSESLNHDLAVIIVVPYQHLVDQWEEDIRLFNINPIVGYSTSPQKNWYERLKKSIRSRNLEIEDDRFLCFVTTNKTYASEKVQELVKRINGNKFLLVDEVHNFGSSGLTQTFKNDFLYRLGLSATINRHHDEEGTKRIIDYFGKICIQYDLARAIREDKLSPYNYYPILTYMNQDDLENYQTLSFEIAKSLIIGKNGKRKLSEYGKIKALERSRLVAGMRDKVDKLMKEIVPYIKDRNLLIYCGATNTITDLEDELEYDPHEKRQIDLVTEQLSKRYKMKVAQFTSRESASQRRQLKNDFSTGDFLQALVAIKCLDEGVNIPSIKTAFILASTTNPKEYIQRRGRILRKSSNKEFAEIYDFIALPRPLNYVANLSEEEKKRDLSLIKNELRRLKEFSLLALNMTESYSIMKEILCTYGLKEENLKEVEFFDE